MEERHLLLRWENNCGELDKQSGTVQFSFEFFWHPFRNPKDSPGGDHSPLLGVTRVPELDQGISPTYIAPIRNADSGKVPCEVMNNREGPAAFLAFPTGRLPRQRFQGSRSVLTLDE